MHTRDYVKDVFAAEGLYKLKDAKMESFLKSIDEAGNDCWPEFIASFRKQYYDLFDRVIPPLMRGRDKLVRTILLRTADLRQKKEAELVRQFVAKADGVEHEAELIELTRKNDKTLNRLLVKVPNVTRNVLRRIETAEKVAAVTQREKKPTPSRQKPKAKNPAKTEPATEKSTTRKPPTKKKPS